MSLPNNVLAVIKSQTSLGLFPICGTETYAGQCLKTKILQFDSDSTLRLTRMDLPFLVICARQILLRAPLVRATVTRDFSVSATPGSFGTSGAPIPNATKTGANGSDGIHGTAGGAGGTLQLPKLYLLVEDILIHPGAPIDWFDLSILMPGADGGPGGPGGFGGRGADGGPGAIAAGKAVPPGNGGRGGTGGPGGTGGQGGDGASLTYIGPQSALDKMSWIKVVNTGGQGGPGGKGGSGGGAGQGGPVPASTPGSPVITPGLSGIYGNSGVDGAAGSPGSKGTVSLILQPSLDSFFS